ncbi:uncharacterized protein BJ171DRAFT_430370 [Polychytrium aggregatum]|uniref:uncharacterized protein n=1 Tax=Polychytrium aggregatum TaxID=110093 RepID=UPI0022FDC178|nr:uncharacterized protein BJ171DRAFT_430370 [Polychytrium aggregatum]KAI9193338.1 hypothetical protein BJ171DRAFT_430370 [Polychytrium aggregatum]
MSDFEELQSYKYQLSQVDEALEKDPENAELLKLKSDLGELITLYTSLTQSASPPRAAAQTPAAASSRDNPKPSSASKKSLAKGQQVQAKWSGDGKFYEATIVDVPPNGEEVAVVFSGYNTRESVKLTDIRDASAAPAARVNIVPSPPSDPSSDERKRELEREAREKEKRKQKKLKLMDFIEKKSAEQSEKQNNWLSFATKGGDSASKKKKPVQVTSVMRKKGSMFATSDDPYAKVGVIGSGKPMTHFQQRGKHIFDANA